MNEQDAPNPDKPAEAKADDPFMPIVESLLGRDSPEFRDALEVAGG